jgi:hypothetical protein
MIFTSALYYLPLWYYVTNTTMPSSINKLRNRPYTVLLCLTLKISDPYIGWPPVICINANNWPRKSSIVFIQSLNLASLTPLAVYSLTNRCLHLGRFWMRSNNHRRPSTGYGIRVSSTKLYPSLLLLRSSNKSVYGTAGTSYSSVTNIISINCLRVVLYNWSTMPQN